MVLGETQILGQVREAYELSRQLESAGPLLNPLFQRAIAAGKQGDIEVRSLQEIHAPQRAAQPR